MTMTPADYAAIRARLAAADERLPELAARIGEEASAEAILGPAGQAPGGPPRRPRPGRLRLVQGG